MGRRLVATLLLLAGCKAELMSSTDDAGSSQDSGSNNLVFLDAGIDAPVVLGPWGTPALVAGASTNGVTEDDCTLSSDKLELYFKRVDADAQLYVMKRATATDTFGTPTALTILNSAMDEESPRLSQDNLTLYFGRSGDIYKSIRTSTASPWQAPTAVAELNTAAYEKWAHVCPSGYAMVSRAVTNNGQNLFDGTITTNANNPVTVFNTAQNEQGTLLSADCLHVWFQSDRDGSFDIFEASRTTPTGAWTNPTKLTDFNTTTFAEEDPWVSTDGRVFVYASNALGSKDLYISTR